MFVCRPQLFWPQISARGVLEVKRKAAARAIFSSKDQSAVDRVVGSELKDGGLLTFSE
jgi:hypothetical protein